MPLLLSAAALVLGVAVEPTQRRPPPHVVRRTTQDRDAAAPGAWVSERRQRRQQLLVRQLILQQQQQGPQQGQQQMREAQQQERPPQSREGFDPFAPLDNLARASQQRLDGAIVEELLAGGEASLPGVGTALPAGPAATARAADRLEAGEAAPLEDASVLHLLEREAAAAADHLLREPSVLRGFSASTGLPTRPVRTRPLGNEDTLRLVQRAWFFLTASDARRELAAEAAEEAEEAGGTVRPPASLQAVLSRMRHTDKPAAAAAASATAAGAAAAAAQSSGVCAPWASRDVAELREMLPPSMSDVEFRLRESIGRAAYNRLFAENQGLIYREVNQVIPNWRDASVMEKADFLQEGAQGLLRALRLFDVGRGVAFSTYAVWHIRAFVLRAVRDKGRLVRLPQALQQDMQQIRRARYRLAVDNSGARLPASQPPPPPMLTIDPGQAALTGLANSATLSLDAADPPHLVVGGGGSARVPTLADRVALRLPANRAGGASGAERLLQADEFASTLRRTQRARDPRRATMARLKYGLEDGREWTYPQLAQRYNMTVDGARGVVRAEVAFLRKEKEKLAHFVE
ncbi:hypothetical protein EMIHUDRAFT_361874 [Emiliania huxleyi CCMP1516]|uniref:RNA polymerase sigma-70 region 2 domain-containing protein n=2 Tax=Emiliania huxleyi TaxID=2903 RepID=A0A0D3KQ95_EMIH1|nr:hypothetical protein EMIHUDRAFT_361874 [Emiliania huxleyi CCMP1516]EOD37930.1 hypothetical protein EMIHUDRAFT_361874 [Emiliania huxleyi CCMP1516]|eukprot:XP_005790359.1 hypothetical protein EMIHUDRAFT_361874 [Emiliania huxleyi CCMP1516]